MDARRIVIEFLGKDVSAGKESDKVGGRLQQTFGKLNKAAIGTLAVAGAAAFKIGDSFEEMENTIIVGTGASGDALDGLTTSAKNIAKTTPASLADVGTAVADLNTRLGLTGKPLEQMSSKFLNLSRITKTDLSQNIANATRVFGDWGIEAADQPKALDAIFEATKRTGIGLDQLTNNVVQFGAPLRQFGFGFEDSLALFGKWEKEGVNTQVVLSGLKQGLGTFSKAGKDPAKALAEVEAAIKGAGSAGEANQIAIEAFGKRAGPDMAAAVREGRFELDDLSQGLKDSGGSIDDADKRTRTFRDSLTLLKNNVMIPLEPVATMLFDKIGSGAKTASEFVQGHSTVVLVATGAIVGLAAAVVTINAATRAWAAITKAWTTVTKVATAIQWAFNVAMSANPIALVVIALIALVAGLVIAYKKSETFRKIVNAAFHAVAGAAKAAFKWVIDKASAALGWIKSNWKTLLAILTGPIGIAVLVISRNWDKIKSGAAAAVQWVKDKFNSVVGFFRGIPGKISSATSGMWDGVKNAFRSAINWLIGKWNSLSFSIPSIDTHIPGVGKIGGFTLSTPNIPYLAKGGIVTKPTLAVIGEAGPEAVVPLSRGGGAIGGGPQVVFTGPVFGDPRAFAREILKLLREEKRLKGAASIDALVGT